MSKLDPVNFVIWNEGKQTIKNFNVYGDKKTSGYAAAREWIKNTPFDCDPHPAYVQKGDALETTSLDEILEYLDYYENGDIDWVS